MSKKNRKNRKARSVLHSLKDLGQDSRDTLSRLATTVRTDVPTLMIGAGATVKKGSYPKNAYTPFAAAKPAGRLSQLAQKMVPFRQSPERAGDLTSHKMKHLAKQIAKGNSGMKVRRSRLPLVAAIFSLMLAAGGYYLFQSISLPELNVASTVGEYLDANKWLGHVSGQVKPDASARKYGVASQMTHSTGTKVTHSTGTKSKRTMAATKAKATPKRTVAKKASKVTKSTEAKRFAKLNKSDKQKLWKAKLAKLKQQTSAHKRTVSHKGKARR